MFHRKAHAVGLREALGCSAVWVSLIRAFAVVVFFGYGRGWWGLGAVIDPVDGIINTGATTVEKYLTGYVVEKTLSIDDIVVIATIFSSPAVPPPREACAAPPTGLRCGNAAGAVPVRAACGAVPYRPPSWGGF